MKSIELLTTAQWHPLAYFNITHPFFTINIDTLIHTWIALVIILIFALCFRFFLSKQGFLHVLSTEFGKSFLDLTDQTLGFTSATHFYFITSLFMFILVCNILSLIPGLEEPTQDLNTTLALGIISFVYIQWYAVKQEGFAGYIRSYFSPFILMFPLNLVGKLASIISISFRLFGNIFGASIISRLYVSAIGGSWIWETLGILTGLNFIIILFFGVFEGFLQAFVFTMLTITYLSIAIKGEEPPIGDLP
jgi:F-type H+-transporting ATPase subunit a